MINLFKKFKFDEAELTQVATCEEIGAVKAIFRVLDLLEQKMENQKGGIYKIDIEKDFRYREAVLDVCKSLKELPELSRIELKEQDKKAEREEP